MKRIKEILLKNIKDNVAAFILLGFIIITFSLTIGVCEYIRYTKTQEVNSNLLVIEEANTELSNNTENTSKTKDNKVIEDEEKLKKENKLSSETDKYYIKVNYGAQVVNVYTKDSKGNYTVPVKAMVCSTGTYTPTSGVYRTLGKGEWWGLIGPSYGQYSTWICRDILFHSVPYLKSGDKSSLEYWAYDQLGQRVSMGCVRLTVADAKWLYNNCPVGTQVEFYSSSNPGPLGKPTTMKISDAPSDIRGWDPTDPDSRNPWPEYLKKLEEEKENDKTNEINNDIIQNEVNNNTTNETINEIVNETTNETINEIVNETTNEIINEIVNETTNEIINETVNETKDENVANVLNETINDMIDTNTE